MPENTRTIEGTLRDVAFALHDFASDILWSMRDSKGWRGERFERKVARMLAKAYPEAKVFHHVYVPKADGSTTEADIVMLRRDGVAVVECKDFAGKIYGKESDSQWIQRLKHDDSRRFYSPVRQNRAHIACLSKVMRRQVPAMRAPYRSFIVFSNRGNIRKAKPYGDDFSVCRYGELRTVIDARFPIGAEEMPPETFEQAAAALARMENGSYDAKAAHTRRLRG